MVSCLRKLACVIKKEKIMLWKKSYLMLIFLATITGFVSCSDDDDDGTDVIEPTGSLVVEDQTLTDGMITISNIVMSDDGWIVLRRDDNGDLGTIIAEEPVEAGTHTDVTFDVGDAQIENGETLWVVLHTDDGVEGTFEFTESGDVDRPILGTGGMEVAESFVITVEGENSVTAEDQAPSEDNTLTISSITLAEDGWVIAHSDADGEIGAAISEPLYLAAGTHTDVEINLNTGVTLAAGDVVYIVLHEDLGVTETFEADIDIPLLGDDDTEVKATINITD